MQTGIDYVVNVDDIWRGILVYFNPRYHGYVEAEREVIIQTLFEASVNGGYHYGKTIFTLLSNYLQASTDLHGDDFNGLTRDERIENHVDAIESWAYEMMNTLLEETVAEDYDTWSIVVTDLDEQNNLYLNLDSEYGRTLSIVGRY